jgi:anti-sigma regulatory factor (Ser/Thr protein kinase)
MKNLKIKTLTVSAHIDSLKPIADYVIQASKAANLDKKKTYKLRLAVDEIVTNIITHGYEETGRTGNITISGEMDSNSLKITLEDTAVFFDPREKMSAEEETIDLPLEDRKMGGLGIYLTINGVDEFQYKRVEDHNFNIFTMYY